MPDYTLLTPQQIHAELANLPGWVLDQTTTTSALTTTYTFPSFVHAIAFMHTVAPAIDQLNHHPEWTNVYNRLIIRTTSHDRDNQLTSMDLRLAHLLHQQHAATV